MIRVSRHMAMALLGSITALLLVAGLAHTGTADELVTDETRELFATNCASCHGPSGTGLTGPSLLDAVARYGTDGVAEIIHDGREQRGMPAWGDRLTDDEIDALVAFTTILPDGALTDDEVEAVELSGLQMPTSMAFADDGGLYIGEKSGIIRYTAAVGRPAVLAANLRERTYDYGELGLTGIEIHDGHLYVTLQTGMSAEECGPFEDNYDQTCPSYGELMRLPIGDDGSLGEPESVRGGPNDPIWCAQFSAHGIAGLYRTEAGQLLVAAGDGAGFFDGDIGQHDRDPCGDGGAFRVQNPSVSQAAGTIAALEDDGSLTTIARGMRNPFAITELDGELYSINTGWVDYEEIDRIGKDHNSGWPCFEGVEPVAAYEFEPECESLLWDEPVYSYPNEDPSAAISALAGYEGRLYFGDYVQQWVKAIDPALGHDQEPELIARQLMPVALAVHDEVLYGLDFFAGNLIRLAGEPPEAESPAETATLRGELDGAVAASADGGIEQWWRPAVIALGSALLTAVVILVRPRHSAAHSQDS